MKSKVKFQDQLQNEKVRQEREIEIAKARERPLLEAMEQQKLTIYKTKATKTEQQLISQSAEFVKRSLHEESIKVMATWWSNFIQSEREMIQNQRQTLDTQYVGNFERIFHQIEKAQIELEHFPKLARPLSQKYDNIELRFVTRIIRQ